MHNSTSELFWSSGHDLSSAEHVVFLGVFNADRYQAKIESWLSRLDLSNTHLVIGNNHSSDDSLDWISTLAKTLRDPVTITRNDRNYGGYGNLAVNLHHFSEAKWITTLHQDDVYHPEHVQSHRALLGGSNNRLGMVCSEARSMLPDGRVVPFPRANWLLSKDVDPVTVFLANLKNHTFPFSGATFARRVIDGFPIPWHSTAFPDTEIIMKMCFDFDVMFASGITVDYLENPESESHSLSKEHRDFGAYQALTRVFAHPNYRAICESVEENQYPMFIEALIEGIVQRIQDEELSLLLRQSVLEITAEYLGTFPVLASELAKGYARVGDKGAMSILEALGANISPSDEAGKPDKNKTPITPANTKINPILLRAFGLLPLPARRILFRMAMKTRFTQTRLKAWDFDWTKR